MITVDKHEGLSVRVAVLNEEVSAQEVEFLPLCPGELKLVSMCSPRTIFIIGYSLIAALILRRVIICLSYTHG